MLFALLALLAAPPASPAPASAEQEVAAFRDELVVALKQGDRARLEPLIADGFTFVHATGGLDTKKEYVDNVVSAVQANRGPDIERLDDHIEVFDGHTAVVTGRAILHGRGDDMPLRSTQVYVKRDGRWLWAGGQSTRLPLRPAAASIPPALREAYAGRYQVGPARVLTVAVQGDVLKAQLPGFREAELIPRTETEFAWFNPDLNLDAQIVFVRDDAGTVTHAAYRRDGKEVWKAARLK